jgi:UDP-glucose 4-epimerase
MYGGDDHFSIVSKIVNAYREDKTLNIFNNGEATRDFIHILDVVKVYRTILDIRDTHILNVGRGIEMSVRELLLFLKDNGVDIKTESRARDELKKSTANISKLLNIMGKDEELIDIKESLLKEINS